MFRLHPGADVCAAVLGDARLFQLFCNSRHLYSIRRGQSAVNEIGHVVQQQQKCNIANDAAQVVYRVHAEQRLPLMLRDAVIFCDSSLSAGTPRTVV